MALFALGINHNHAEIAQRELLARQLRVSKNIAQNMLNERAIEEAVVLSTCNRTEIYTVTKCHHAVKAWMRRQLPKEDALLINKMYEHHDLRMIKHLMSVASGLDSMILGEPQILGQIKQSFQLALDEKTVGPQFKNLFPAVFEVAKLVRTQTDIGRNPVTLTYAVIQLARQFFQEIKNTRVLLIGAGETIELMANYFAEAEVKNIYITNRTLEHAHNLARRFKGMPVRFDEFKSVLGEVDLIISATASDQPILDKAMLERARSGVNNKPVFIADLAVPRDVEAAVSELRHVHLYNIDHLQQVVDANRKSRVAAKEQANAIIEVQASHYLRQLRVLDAGDMIRSFRQKMGKWREEELARAFKSLDKNIDPRQVLEEFARNLTNKFMHEPTAKLRDAAYAEHEGLMELLQELYEL